MESKKPLKTYKAGGLTLNMWENELDEGKMKSFTFQKSYKDKNDKWQHTQNLRTNDLPRLRTLIEEAYRENTIETINKSLSV